MELSVLFHFGMYFIEFENRKEVCLQVLFINYCKTNWFVLSSFVYIKAYS